MTARRRVRSALDVALTAALTTVLATTLAGCADDGAQPPPSVVAVEVQRCAQPNRLHGVGVVVGDDLVVTAGHVVEGDLRSLAIVDGDVVHPATVVALDRRRDLALLAADLDDEVVTASLADRPPDEATLVTPDGATVVSLDRHVTQVVDHATDQATYRREVVVFAPAVDTGTSGAPLLDASGRVVAIVIATLDGETYAVTAEELADLLDGADVSTPSAASECP